MKQTSLRPPTKIARSRATRLSHGTARDAERVKNAQFPTRRRMMLLPPKTPARHGDMKAEPSSSCLILVSRMPKAENKCTPKCGLGKDARPSVKHHPGIIVRGGFTFSRLAAGARHANEHANGEMRLAGTRWRFQGMHAWRVGRGGLHFTGACYSRAPL